MVCLKPGTIYQYSQYTLSIWPKINISITGNHTLTQYTCLLTGQNLIILNIGANHSNLNKSILVLTVTEA